MCLCTLPSARVLWLCIYISVFVVSLAVYYSQFAFLVCFAEKLEYPFPNLLLSVTLRSACKHTMKGMLNNICIEMVLKYHSTDMLCINHNHWWGTVNMGVWWRNHFYKALQWSSLRLALYNMSTVEHPPPGSKWWDTWLCCWRLRLPTSPLVSVAQQSGGWHNYLCKPLAREPHGVLDRTLGTSWLVPLYWSKWLVHVTSSSLRNPSAGSWQTR